MTPWIVDSCVLLDIALRDPAHGLASALFLDKRRKEGLAVCPVSIIEIAPFFAGEIGHVREFLKVLGADAGRPWLEADTEVAVRGWSRYVGLKRQGTAPRRPLADMLIGAYASRHSGLITRNPSHFRPYFPDLPLAQPPA
jgi:predicted nucleic acid-binding protein